MGINYPGSPPGSATDTFTTPANPEGTPLAEAGSGTRDLVESVQDEGSAITALQQWAALRTHDHSGDSTSVAAGAKLNQANTHQSADTDTAITSIHHTIDPTLSSATQAAPALHTHDYNTLPNGPIHKCTTTTRPPGPVLGDMIWETDTNTFRVWSQFSPSDVAQVGMYTTDTFSTGGSPSSLGSNWNQVYMPIDATLNPDGTAGGVMAVPDNSNAQWVFDYAPYGSGGKNIAWPPHGWPWPYVQGRCIAQRTLTADKHTLTNDQSFTWQAGPTAMPYNNPWPPTPSSNDVYLRMSDDGQTYCRVAYSYTPGVMFVLWLIIILIEIPLAAPTESVLVYATTTGPTGEALIGKLSHPHFDPFSTYEVDIQANKLTFYLDSVVVGTVVDSGNQIVTGSSNRGWGIGMTVARAPSWGQVYSHPTLMNQIWMRDIAYYTGSPIWQLMALGARPVVQYHQAVAQALNHAGSLITWDTVDEDNFAFLNPAVNTTDIHIKESGIYDIDCAIQWDSQHSPDVANVVLLLNGQPTAIRQQQTLKAAAGFSQTVSFAGRTRFAAGDLVQIQAFYTSSSTLWNLINSYTDAPSKTMSRIHLLFLGP